MVSRSKKKVWAFAFLLCLAGDLFFLRDALFTDDVRAPGADIVHARPFCAEFDERPAAAANPGLTDWSFSIHSWQKLVRESLRQGHLPLWNDRAGCGQPLIGNLQAETFSPYQPLNLVAGDQYVDWKQLAQLLVAQAGALLLMWTLGASPWAGLLAALGFSFGSYMQEWAVHPVAGSAAFAPALLAVFIRVRERFSLPLLAAGAVLVACSITAGHPESTLWACMAGCAVAFFMARPKESPWAVVSRLRFTSQALLIGLAGLGLAACQVLPFLEYQSESAFILIRRAAPKSFLDPSFLYGLLDAQAFGFPGSEGGFRPAENYAEVMVHVGRIVLALAGAGLLGGLLQRRRGVLPLVVVTACGLGIAFSPPAFQDLLDVYPLNIMRLMRFHIFASILLPVLGGLGFDILREAVADENRRGWVLMALASLPLLLLTLLATGAFGTTPWGEGPAQPELHSSTWLIFLALPLFTFLVERFGGARRVLIGTCVLCAAVFIEAVLLWQPFVPTASVRTLQPRSYSLSYMESRNDQKRLLPAPTLLPPETASLFDITSLRTYDGMGMKRLFSLMWYQKAFLGVPVHAPIFRVNPEVLDMMSVGWTLTPYPPELSPFPLYESFLEPGQKSEFTFPVDKRRRLEFIVSARSAQPLLPGSFTLTVTTPDHKKLSFPWGGERPAAPWGRFSTRGDQALGFYVERLRIQHSRDHFILAFEALPELPEGTMLKGQLALSENCPPLLVRTIVRGGLNSTKALEHRGIFLGIRSTSLPRAYLAARTEFVPEAPATELARTEEERRYTTSITRVSEPRFDCHVLTLIESAPSAAFDTGGQREAVEGVDLERLSSGRFRCRVNSEKQEVLVFSECFARGWRAFLDGQPARVVPANVTSMAVAVPAGDHEVVFEYWPRTLTWGFWITGATAVLLLGLVVRALGSRKRGES